MFSPLLASLRYRVLFLLLLLVAGLAQAAKLVPERPEMGVGETQFVRLEADFVLLVNWSASPELRILDSGRDGATVKAVAPGNALLTANVNGKDKRLRIAVQARPEVPASPPPAAAPQPAAPPAAGRDYTAPPPSPSSTQRETAPGVFENPMVDGVALDICREWASNCGKPAADAFCRGQGYTAALEHREKHDSPPTRVISSKQVCDGGFCDRIVWIRCTTTTAAPASMRLSGSEFRPGETLAVDWTASPDYADNAWIGIVPASVPHGDEAQNDRHDIAYQYLHKRASGRFEFRAPDTPGAYDLRMHDRDDNGREVASIGFRVVAAGTGGRTYTAPPAGADHVRVEACVDGSDWLSVEQGRLQVQHRNWVPIGAHPDCPASHRIAGGGLIVDGARVPLSRLPVAVAIANIGRFEQERGRGQIRMDGPGRLLLDDDGPGGPDVYVLRLYPAPQSPQSRAGEFLGCYRDQASRDLGAYSFVSDRMTTALCLETCGQRGHAYAATQYSAHCFCDDDYGALGRADNCDMPCAGNAAEKCGGAWANSVYATGAADQTGGSGGDNLALNRPASQSSTSQWSRTNDAQGAVDGIINGAYAFHTNHEANPWWQVDLGRTARLDRVRIYNRLDCCAERARSLSILLSDDGGAWREVYRHDGKLFGGKDGKPLVVPLNGQSGRYVRLRLNETNWFHLDEVEVYGIAAGGRDYTAGGRDYTARPGGLPAGLIAHFAMGRNLTDRSGQGHRLDDHGSAPEADRHGRPGGARQLDGQAYLETDVDINPARLPQLTLAAWVRADDASPVRQVFSHDDGGYDRSLGIDYRGGGSGWSLFTGAGVLGYKPVQTGLWTFVAGVWDQNARKARLHVDDAVFEAGNVAAGGGRNTLRIGMNPGFGEHFKGAVDEVWIFERALSPEEIDALRARAPRDDKPRDRPKGPGGR